MAIRRPLQSNETAQLAARLMKSLPAATFELDTFLRLAGVVASRKIPTAAMECVHRPRLLLNPDFVEKYCKRDEHLFLLVMHELWHVLMAHTSLYPRMTPAHNIAFDAIINAGLMHNFDKPEYMGFFEVLNPPDQFPHLLLRPPVGWPDDPVYPDVGPIGTKRVLQQLYPPPGAPYTPMPFYHEILDLILQDALENGRLILTPRLLGDHDDLSQKKRLLSNIFFNDVLDKMTERWPVLPDGYIRRNRGWGDMINPWEIEKGASSEAVRRTFAGVLRRCLKSRPGHYYRKMKMPVAGISGMSVLPNGRDRLAPARKMLGAPATLWAQPGDVKARIPEKPSVSHIYLDVSGSMNDVIPHLVDLILPYVANGQAEVFQFSTIVEPLSFHDLRNRLLTTTGGTDISCVMKHLLEVEKSVQRVLILTDGYTGEPSAESQAVIRERGMKVHIVLPDESPHQQDLESIATSFTVLPPLLP